VALETNLITHSASPVHTKNTLKVQTTREFHAPKNLDTMDCTPSIDINITLHTSPNITLLASVRNALFDHWIPHKGKLEYAKRNPDTRISITRRNFLSAKNAVAIINAVTAIAPPIFLLFGGACDYLA